LQEGAVGLLQGHLEGVLVHDLDTLDAGELREGQQAIGLVEPAIKIDLGGLGVEFLAVVKLDALPELPREDLPAVGDRPRLRELRHQLLVLVPAHEAFEHHALHEHRGHVAGGGGIEAGGVRLGRHHDGPTARLGAGHEHGHAGHEQ